MKIFYSLKGQYPDGRNKVVIVQKSKKKKVTKTLPMPEVLLSLLEKKDTPKTP